MIDTITHPDGYLAKAPGETGVNTEGTSYPESSIGGGGVEESETSDGLWNKPSEVDDETAEKQAAAILAEVQSIPDELEGKIESDPPTIENVSTVPAENIEIVEGDSQFTVKAEPEKVNQTPTVEATEIDPEELEKLRTQAEPVVEKTKTVETVVEEPVEVDDQNSVNEIDDPEARFEARKESASVVIQEMISDLDDIDAEYQKKAEAIEKIFDEKIGQAKEVETKGKEYKRLAEEKGIEAYTIRTSAENERDKERAEIEGKKAKVAESRARLEVLEV